MNVAHFTSEFYPHPGGVQECVRQLTARQKMNGDAPVVITNRWPKDLVSAEIYEGIPVKRFVFRVPEMNWRQLTGAAVFAVPTLMRIMHFLRKLKIGLIHIQCISSNAYYALHASRALNIPLIATLHGELTVDNSALFQRSRFARKLFREVIDSASIVTACSQNTLMEAESFYGKELTGKSRVIHNGVLTEEFTLAQPYPHPRPYILAIGRHVRQKGFDLLLEAFAKVIHEGENTHDLIIAGDGPERQELEELSYELRIRRHVRFTGVTDRPTTASLFTGCSFFVLPSRQEPLGIVNLEAMASGKAVLASNIGGVPEIIEDNQTGILVPPEDVTTLAHGIRRFIKNPDLRARLGTAGLELSQCYHWRNVAAQYEEIYQSLRP